MARESTIEIEVGLFVRGTIRDFLDQCRFRGMDVRYYEDKGILDSTFEIRGNPDDVHRVTRMLRQYETD